MKLFLSWSKPRSGQVASLLRDWLPTVVQRLEPWMSTEDIDKGQRWSAELAELLAATSQGLVCVTADNMREPWLHFEAGALAKSVTLARVRPVLLDVSPADVTGPLTQFQATSLTDRTDMLRLVESLNAGTDRPLSAAVLRTSFDRAWPEFHAKIGDLAKLPSDGQPPSVRRPEDKVDEILELVRDLERRLSAAGVGQVAVSSGYLSVDFSEIDLGLGVYRFKLADFNSVSQFLNTLYPWIRDYVAPYTYGIQWELYDRQLNAALDRMGTAWAQEHDRARDTRPLWEAGLMHGMALAARFVPATG